MKRRKELKRKSQASPDKNNIIEAITKGLNALKSFIHHFPERINDLDERGENAWYHVLLAPRLENQTKKEMISCLIAAGLDINFLASHDLSATLLTRSISIKNDDLVSFLLSLDDIDIEKNHGPNQQSPIIACVLTNNSFAFEALLKHPKRSKEGFKIALQVLLRETMKNTTHRNLVKILLKSDLYTYAEISTLLPGVEKKYCFQSIMSICKPKDFGKLSAADKEQVYTDIPYLLTNTWISVDDILACGIEHDNNQLFSFINPDILLDVSSTMPLLLQLIFKEKLTCLRYIASLPEFNSSLWLTESNGRSYLDLLKMRLGDDHPVFQNESELKLPNDMTHATKLKKEKKSGKRVQLLNEGLRFTLDLEKYLEEECSDVYIRPSDMREANSKKLNSFSKAFDLSDALSKKNKTTVIIKKLKDEVGIDFALILNMAILRVTGIAQIVPQAAMSLKLVIEQFVDSKNAASYTAIYIRNYLFSWVALNKEKGFILHEPIESYYRIINYLVLHCKTNESHILQPVEFEHFLIKILLDFIDLEYLNHLENPFEYASLILLMIKEYSASRLPGVLAKIKATDESYVAPLNTLAYLAMYLDDITSILIRKLENSIRGEEAWAVIQDHMPVIDLLKNVMSVLGEAVAAAPSLPETPLPETINKINDIISLKIEQFTTFKNTSFDKKNQETDLETKVWLELIEQEKAQQLAMQAKMVSKIVQRQKMIHKPMNEPEAEIASIEPVLSPDQRVSELVCRLFTKAQQGEFEECKIALISLITQPDASTFQKLSALCALLDMQHLRFNTLMSDLKYLSFKLEYPTFNKRTYAEDQMIIEKLHYFFYSEPLDIFAHSQHEVMHIIETELTVVYSRLENTIDERQKYDYILSYMGSIVEAHKNSLEQCKEFPGKAKQWMDSRKTYLSTTKSRLMNLPLRQVNELVLEVNQYLKQIKQDVYLELEDALKIAQQNVALFSTETEVETESFQVSDGIKQLRQHVMAQVKITLNQFIAVGLPHCVLTGSAAHIISVESPLLTPRDFDYLIFIEAHLLAEAEEKLISLGFSKSPYRANLWQQFNVDVMLSEVPNPSLDRTEGIPDVLLQDALTKSESINSFYVGLNEKGGIVCYAPFPEAYEHCRDRLLVSVQSDIAAQIKASASCVLRWVDIAIRAKVHFSSEVAAAIQDWSGPENELTCRHLTALAKKHIYYRIENFQDTEVSEYIELLLNTQLLTKIWHIEATDVTQAKELLLERLAKNNNPHRFWRAKGEEPVVNYEVRSEEEIREIRGQVYL